MTDTQNRKGPGNAPHVDEATISDETSSQNSTEFPEVSFTRLVAKSGVLTKSYQLNEAGKVVKGPSPSFSDGIAELTTVPLNKILAGTLLDRACNIYGKPTSRERPDGKWNVRTFSDASKQASGGTIARTKEEFGFAGPGVLLLDNDPNPDALPPVPALSGAALMAIIEQILPEAASSAFLAAPSASSGIVIEATGESIPGKGGVHLYLAVEDASDIARFGEVLFKRLWLAGHGSIALSASGSMLVRSIIDASVFQSNRIDYIAPAKLGKGMSRIAGKPESRAGGYLDTRALPDLTEAELAEYTRRVTEVKGRIKPRSQKAKAAFVDRKTEELIERGVDPKTARHTAAAAAKEGQSVSLGPDYVLVFAELGQVLVRDVLADLVRFDRKALADPLEGTDYGTTTATFYANLGNGVPCIHSHAHGAGTRFLLQSDEEQERAKSSEHKAEAGSSAPKIDLIDPVSGKPKSQATLLIEIGSQYQLIHDADRNAYAINYRNGAREVWPIRSLGFKHLLAGEFYQLTGKGFNRNAAGDALDTLEAKAIHTGRQHPVYLRVARTETALYLDLCDEGWRVIEVTAAGWRVLETSPVHFVRKAGMLSLPIPAGEGDLGKLRRLINLDESAGHFELVVGWMLGALRGRSPFPILVLEGEQGTGKSTASRIIRRFVDPSTVALRSPPKDPRDLIVSAVNNYLVCLDNLSGINAEISDCLCRFATGGGLDLRKLYTDVDTVMIDIQRPILCNGIDDICHRPDLAERAIILHLPVLEAPTRVTESKIWEEVGRSSPSIMAGLLDALSAALANEATTHLKHKPRMADFAVWVSAAESATPWNAGSFMAAYQAMRGRAVEEGIEASPAGSVLVDYLRSKAPITRWSPTPTHLYDELTRLAGSRANSQAWPRTPRSMGQALKRIAPNLRAVGITFTKDKDHDRLYHFFVSDIVHRAKEAPEAPKAPTEQPEATDDVACSDSETWAHQQNPKTRSAHQNGEAPKAPKMRPEQKPSNDGACSDFMGAMGGMGAFSDDCTVRHEETPPLVDPIAGGALNPATSMEF